MKIERIRVTRGHVLIRRDDWQTKHDSPLDIAIPETYQQQTWAGTVMAVGPPAYAFKFVADEFIGGPTKTRKKVLMRDGKPVLHDYGIRQGMRVTCRFATPGSVELDVDVPDGDREKWMLFPVEDAYGELNILYAEEAA